MPASRVCPEPGCPALTQSGRCPQHARPSTVARGYGQTHKAERAANQRLMDEQGYLTCWRCQGRIDQGEPWDIGHDEQRASRGPEHANRCNRAAAGRKSAELQKI